MLENEFNFSDDLFGIQDINTKQDNIVEKETKKNFPKTVENLRAVLSFFDEIDGFVAKQMELFGILNVKFPNISQFTVALSEAKDINLNIEKYRELLSSSLEKCENIQKEIEQTDSINETLLKISLNTKKISENEDILEELKKIVSKIEQ